MVDLSSEALALLASVRDNHADDTPRLIFADYLDERGTPEAAARAEFVRVQVELAVRGNHDVSTRGLGLKQCCGCGSQQICERCIELRDRERELLDNPDNSNWRQFAPVDGERFSAFSNEFRRGFVSRIRCTWNQWSRHGDSILADPWVPGLDKVELTTWPEDVRSLCVKHGLTEDSPRRPGSYLTRVALSREWPQVRAWKLPPEPREPARCEVCDWPLAARREDGCVPGNCAYRPDEDSAEGRRIRRRREELGRTR